MTRLDDPLAAHASGALREAETTELVALLCERVGRLEHQLRGAQWNNRQRNLSLDALHFVWCSGGCVSGVHRFENNRVKRAEEHAEAVIAGGPL